MDLSDVKDYGSFGTLLAADTIDASAGVLFGKTAGAGIAPATENCTILIGLGGTGVETLDFVKGAISKRMAPTWNNYVAFLGIDSDGNEFNKARYLNPHMEEINITEKDVNKRAQDETKFPYAWHSFMPGPIANAAIVAGDGCSRTRLYGRMKIHDCNVATSGVDEKIVTKIEELAKGRAPSGKGSFEVFVIGSVSGGTCSGAFLEMPYLIRQALGDAHLVNIYAMLFLPDTLTGLDPAYAGELRANGYASLKELDYFQGISMREGYPEKKQYNGAMHTLSLDHSKRFYSLPYLIASRDGGTNEAKKIAQEEIAEFVLSLVCQTDFTDPKGKKDQFNSSSFLNNAMNHITEKDDNPIDPNKEATGEYHEYPKHYSAIGFAKAAAPKEVAYAYEVGKICKNAGLKPISDAARAALPSTAIMPFRGKNNPWTKAEGESEAKALMNSLKGFLSFVHEADFRFSAHFNATVDWDGIHNKNFDGREYEDGCTKYVAQQTDATLNARMKTTIQQYYQQFEQDVKIFVKKEGPHAFVSLFDGVFIQQNQNDAGLGIKSMLENLREGKNLEGKAYSGWLTVTEARKKRDECRNAIDKTNPGLLNKHVFKKDMLAGQASEWEKSYNQWVNMRIVEKRRELALGPDSLFDQEFVRRAMVLRDRMEAFGNILSALSDAYEARGSKMSSFQTFEKAQVSKCEINIAATDPSAYNWIMQQTAQALGQINAQKFRDGLVEDFFAKPEEWMQIPEGYVETKAVGYVLTVKERPVPARVCFDRQMSEYLTSTLDVSIEKMFEQMQNAGVDISSTATAVLQKLYASSKIPDGINYPAQYKYIVYPKNLSGTPVGAQVVAALSTAAPSVFGDGVSLYASNDASSIMAYQQAVPFPIYKLSGLEQWEADYEVKMKSLHNYLHGKSQDITISAQNGTTVFNEGYTWAEYPPIFPRVNARMPDPQTGLKTREGELLATLDQEIAEAKRLGVLYCEQLQNGQYRICRVHCDKTRDWGAGRENVFIQQCRPDPQTNELPVGAALARAIVEWNGMTIASVSRPVKLAEGGLMEKDHISEEYAWMYAARVLRFHMPMRAEIRETVKLFRTFGEQVDAYNALIAESNKPAKMIQMLKSLVIEETNGFWQINKKNGQSVMLANLTENMKKFLLPQDTMLINNGFFTYFLYQKLCEVVKTKQEFDELSAYALELYNRYLTSGDEASLELGKKQADLAEAEKAALKAAGATLDGKSETELSRAFINNMSNIIADKALLKDIDLFYGRI